MKAHPLQNIRRASTLPANYQSTAKAHVRINQINKHQQRLQRRSARFVAQGGRIEVDEQKTQRWILGGLLHREDGPAVVYVNGDYEYYHHGQRHRQQGPAYCVAGLMQWFYQDQLHREDGPALVDHCKDLKEWFVHGEAVDGLAVVERGHKKYFKDDVLHRDMDLPAIDGPDVQEWHIHGIRHRIQKPAVVWLEHQTVVGEEYYVDGLLHREHGKPAVWLDKRLEWWVDGRRQRDDDQPTQIIDDNMFWHNQHGQTHRDNGPAIVLASGHFEYHQCGLRHRTDDLPAVVESDGTLRWYIKGNAERSSGGPAVHGPCGIQYASGGWLSMGAETQACQKYVM